MSLSRLKIAGLTFSAVGLISIATREWYTNEAIIPTKGDVPTYGFGTTIRPDGAPVQLGDRTNPVQALKLKQRDITKFEGAIKRCVKVPLHQHEYDVYVDLTYNIGPTAFCNSTIVRRLNAEDYRGACDAILLFKKYKGQDCSLPNKVCAGLWTDRLKLHAACVKEPA